jgi:glycosyltransferase involved in cell wall biosynthesis
MKLSILLPVYNEEAHLQTLLNHLLALNFEKEIVAVDDASTDQSWAILQRFARENVMIVRHAANQGKGAAIRTALAHATGDYVIIQDADDELDPDDIPRLLEPIRNATAVVVYGARDLRVQRRGISLIETGITRATNLLFGTRLSDMMTCYKVMPTQVMRALDLQSNHFGIESEITAKLARKGYRIAEVPISYQPRTLNKKMRPLRDGTHILFTLLKYRFL